MAMQINYIDTTDDMETPAAYRSGRVRGMMLKLSFVFCLP